MENFTKQQRLENITIESFANEGKSLTRIGGKVIFVEGAVPGDVGDVIVYRNKRDFAEARLDKLITPSTFRVPPACSHFGVCGGCQWQHMEYKQQLYYKQQSVAETLKRLGKVEAEEVIPIAGATQIYNYRNKLEFTFSNKAWVPREELGNEAMRNQPALGFHIPGLFDKVLDVKKCHLQSEPSNYIRLAVRDYAIANQLEFFDLRQQTGFLRNLIIRSTSVGELMVVLSVAQPRQVIIDGIMNMLKKTFPEITSLNYTVNTKRNDTLYDQDIICFSGKDHIVEELEGLKFRISPKSFFQTNSQQALNLYTIARQFAGLKSTDLVYDLYTGTGSIALFVSKYCKKVVGIESVPDAISDARKNADMNQISNCEFFVGDMKDALSPDFVKINGMPDVVITDPPRVGMHEEVVNNLLTMQSGKIVYVSCNPATQARDLQLLSEKYRIVKSQAVDMFPHTSHLENVVLLTLKDKSSL